MKERKIATSINISKINYEFIQHIANTEKKSVSGTIDMIIDTYRNK